MTLARTALRVVVLWTAGILFASGVNVPCAAGTRVYSLDVWSGAWLDGLTVRCTGDSEEQTIPPEFNDEPGGNEKEGICAGTGGVQSIEWGVPDVHYYVMAYVNITCLDNKTYRFSHGKSYDYWNITSHKTVSCDDGKYVQGITYTADYPEETRHSYFLTDIGFICSSSTLDPICTYCSGDRALLGMDDQPEYCELPSCSETECCESNAEEKEAITTTVIIGVVSTVVAAMILSGSAWIWNRVKNKNATTRGVEVIGAADGPTA